MEIHLTSKECDERLTKCIEEHKNEEKEEHTCSCGGNCSCVNENDKDEEPVNVFDSVVALGNTIQDPLRTGVKQK
jgi:hypothetical protein